MPRVIYALLVVLVFSACIPAFAALPVPRKHLFQTQDTVTLVADIYVPLQPGDRPVVLLLHQLGQSRVDYAPLLEPLWKAGFLVCNVDLRGHGNSVRGLTPAAAVDFKKFTDRDWAMLPTDVTWVLKNLAHLKSVDKTKLFIVGASIGANSAIVAAANNPDVQGVVALSPGLNFHNIKPSAAATTFQRPLLLIAASDDKYSAESIAKLHQDDKLSEVVQLPTGGHGTNMFKTHPELIQRITDWLVKTSK